MVTGCADRSSGVYHRIMCEMAPRFPELFGGWVAHPEEAEDRGCGSGAKEAVNLEGQACIIA